MNVLEEAAALINGDRAKDYGDVSENFERIAKLWGAYRGQFFDRHDVSMMMILVKVARQSNGYHRDSAVDIAGYTALGEQVHDEFELELTVAPEPRVWESILDVPIDAVVTDVDEYTWKFLGDYWHYDVDGEWLRGISPIVLHDEDCPPYTEVLETT